MAVLASFYDNIDTFLLVFVRVMGFFMLVPIVSSANIPVQVRLTMAVCLSVVLFSAGIVTAAEYDNSIAGYFGLMLTEFLVGVFLGYILYFIFTSVLYAGQIIDYKIGFAMVNVLDPMTQIQVPVAGNLLYMMVSVMMVVSGGVHAFIYAFGSTYYVLPIGAGNLVGNAPLAWYAMMMLTNFLLMGVKIAMPILAAMMVIDVALGIMVKTVPQMNIFAVGMPIKVIIGLILLLLAIVPMMSFVYSQLFDSAIRELMEITRGLAQ
jgi:flagellar biosynthetic protein FliR